MAQSLDYMLGIHEPVRPLSNNLDEMPCWRHSCDYRLTKLNWENRFFMVQKIVAIQPDMSRWLAVVEVVLLIPQHWMIYATINWFFFRNADDLSWFHFDCKSISLEPGHICDFQNSWEITSRATFSIAKKKTDDKRQFNCPVRRKLFNRRGISKRKIKECRLLATNLLRKKRNWPIFVWYSFVCCML